MLLLDPGSVKRIRPEAVGASSALKRVNYQKHKARKTSGTAKIDPKVFLGHAVKEL